MANTIPYLVSSGSITKALEKIKSAATPERVTYDFVSTVVGLKGGTGRAIIPFLKRAGLVRTDGTPTDLYNQFRNSHSSKISAATAFRNAFKTIYERNEYAHKLSDEELKGLIVEITGHPLENRVTQSIFGTMKAFKAFCDFEGKQGAQRINKNDHEESSQGTNKGDQTKELGIRLGYTINLNLPPTDDIRVFDAIFRSLKEHLLKE